MEFTVANPVARRISIEGGQAELLMRFAEAFDSPWMYSQFGGTFGDCDGILAYASYYTPLVIEGSMQ